MRYDPEHESSDVVDARRRSGGGGGVGLSPQILILLFRFASRWGWGGIALAAVAVGGFYLISSSGSLSPSGPIDDNDPKVNFVSFVLDDVQDFWGQRLQGYDRAKLILFRGSIGTACGYGQSATGPFYCPGDQQVYIDLSFYDQLARNFGAPGDFAQAYVVAHEIGHHVQHLLGTTSKVPRGQAAAGPNGASVRLELQADCYAGAWAKSAQERQLLEAGDLEESLRAAAAIGDDRLQKQGSGTVAPDSFTHGTSEQRMRWFMAGYESGDPRSCDTFSASQL